MTSEYNLADQTLAALSAPKVGLISYESVPNICPSVARRNSKGERVTRVSELRALTMDFVKLLVTQ